MQNQSPSYNTIYAQKQLRSPMLQSVLLIVIIVLFGWFILQPKYASTKASRAELDSFKQQQATLEADREELNRLINKLEDSEDEIKLVDEAVPLKTRATEISVLIESYSRATGLLLSQLNITGLEKFIAAGDKESLENPYAPGRDLQTADVQVVVTGSIDQFRNFLQLLETSGRIIDVDNLEVTSTSEGVTFRLRMKTYAYMVGGPDPLNPAEE